eukprot:GHVO01016597.1.p1 GENE.GHVO01016597.1~~GHVO01016597.1.p1  ORF type:complete len:1224 (+),score=235.49 GHVO01016597.1:109-3672(+)
MKHVCLAVESSLVYAYPCAKDGGPGFFSSDGTSGNAQDSSGSLPPDISRGVRHIYAITRAELLPFRPSGHLYPSASIPPPSAASVSPVPLPSSRQVSSTGQDDSSLPSASHIRVPKAPDTYRPNPPPSPALMAATAPSIPLQDAFNDYLTCIEKMLITGFYFSYDMDISHSSQYKFQNRQEDENQQIPCPHFLRPSERRKFSQESKAFVNLFDRRFFWNLRMCEHVAQWNVDPRWMVPVMQGSISSFRYSYRGNHMDVILICRRSAKMGGTRYNARGIDSEGNVANFCESEMMVNINQSMLSPTDNQRGAQTNAPPRSRSCRGWASLIQVRGSVPLFWSQTGQSKSGIFGSRLRINPEPKLFGSHNKNTKAFTQHVSDSIARYGKIYMINLLSFSKGGEPQLTRVLRWQLERFNSTHKGLEVGHIPWDFHAQSKMKGFETALNEFMMSIVLASSSSGFFSSGQYWKERHSLDTDRPKDSPPPDDTVRYQDGVIRTNCLDCLDRTNAFQWFYGWSWLQQIMHEKKVHAYYCIGGYKHSLNRVPSDPSMVRHNGGFGHTLSPMATHRRSHTPERDDIVVSYITPSGISQTVRYSPTVMSWLPTSGDGDLSVSPAEMYTQNILKDAIAQMWAHHGDLISLQYTGTGSVLSALIRQGKPSLSTNVNHVLKSIGRVYQNTFGDAIRQEAVDIVLGTHVLSPRPPQRSCIEAAEGVTIPSKKDGSVSEMDETEIKWVPLIDNETSQTSSLERTDQLIELKDDSEGPLDDPQSNTASDSLFSAQSNLPFEEILQETGNKPSEEESVTWIYIDPNDPLDIFNTSAQDGNPIDHLTSPKSVDTDTRSKYNRLHEPSDPPPSAVSEQNLQSSTWKGPITIKHKPFRVWIGTWNLNGRDSNMSFDPWLSPPHAERINGTAVANMYVLCLQEVVKLSGVAAFVNSGDLGKHWNFDRHMKGLLGPDFVKIRSTALVGLYISIFIAEDWKKDITDVDICEVKLGFGGQMGNKGAIGVRCKIGTTTCCFINAHLTSGLRKYDQQQRASQIEKLLSSRFEAFQHVTVSSHDVVILTGDLNFRLRMEDDEAWAALSRKNVNKMLECDEFNVMKQSQTFRHIREAPIQFIPTYRFKRNEAKYDKVRPPAWCDRVLWTGQYIVNGCSSWIKPLLYDCNLHFNASDHKPVFAIMDISVALPELIGGG